MHLCTRKSSFPGAFVAREFILGLPGDVSPAVQYLLFVP